MKRYNNLYEKIYNIENIKLAHKNAKKGKLRYKEVIQIDKNENKYFSMLQSLLKNRTFANGKYSIYVKQFYNKERTIYKLPYFPDRIIHHCIVQILEFIWNPLFIRNTFSSLKHRGIHDALHHIRNDIQNELDCIYCLKFDIKKFYPSVNHDILKSIIRKKIKDAQVLWLLDVIIDSADGLPIGNYLSQYFGNLYLAYFDHWMKEHQHCKYYYRYCDDIVILSDNKEFLHEVLTAANEYLLNKLQLHIKENWQIFPIKSRGIDFLGYVIYNKYCLLRKRIKENFKYRLVDIRINYKHISNKNLLSSVMSYYGWLKFSNAYNLWNRLINKDMYAILVTCGLK